MRASIAVLMLSVFFVTLIFLQLDMETANLANTRVKEALNRATHDAGLMVDLQEQSNGRIVFDTTAAINALKATLQDNLALDSDLTPLPNTLFTDTVSIDFIEFVDDNDGFTYPYLYENPTYHITKAIKGPSVVAVISVTRPIISGLAEPWKIRKASVYEYPGLIH